MKKSIVFVLLFLLFTSVCSAQWKNDWVMVSENDFGLVYYSPSSIEHKKTNSGTDITLAQVKVFLKQDNTVHLYVTAIRDSDLHYMNSDVKVYKSETDYSIQKSTFENFAEPEKDSVREDLNRVIVNYSALSEVNDWKLVDENDLCAVYFSSSSVKHEIRKGVNVSYGQVKLYDKKANKINIFMTLVRDSDLYYFDDNKYIYVNGDLVNIEKTAKKYWEEPIKDSIREAVNYDIVNYGR